MSNWGDFTCKKTIFVHPLPSMFFITINLTGVFVHVKHPSILYTLTNKKHEVSVISLEKECVKTSVLNLLCGY